MATRITVADYRLMRRDTRLSDPAIEVFIGLASRRIDSLVGLGPTTEQLIDAERWLTLYLALSADPRKKSEGIPPASTSYELVDYLALLRLTLGKYFPLLGEIEGPVLRTAKIDVITANVA